MTSSYIEFYNQHGIMPVKQDVSTPDFKLRRRFLYRTLGVPSSFPSERKVLEFGPGGGFNATALANGKPMKLYWCVEGADLGVDLLKNHFNQGLIQSQNIRIFQEDFLSFNTKERFDLVIAEACIPGQAHPAATLQHISKFVNKNGYLIITCTSHASLLSEALRAVYAKMIRSEVNKETYEALISKVFAEHLSTLGTTTRSVRDWIDDNIHQNWHERKADFNLIEATKALKNFEFVHSNPQMTIDLEWYKKYDIKNSGRIRTLKNIFPFTNLALLDIRISIEEIFGLSTKDINLANDLISNVYKSAKTFLIKEKSNVTVRDLDVKLEKLLKCPLISRFPTHSALVEFHHFLKEENKAEYSLEEMKFWWGRGQQYASFIRI